MIVVTYDNGYATVDRNHEADGYSVDDAGQLDIFKKGGYKIATYSAGIWKIVNNVS